MPSFRQNAVWILMSNFVYALSQWWILSFMSKMGHTEQIGNYSIALSINTPIVVFASLSLRTYISSDKTDKYTFQEYFILRLMMLFLALICIIFVLLFVKYDFTVKLLICSVGLSKILESISDIIYSYHQQKETMKSIAVSIVVRNILIFIVFSIVYYSTENIILSSWLLIFCYGFTIFFVDLKSLPDFIKKTISIKIISNSISNHFMQKRLISIFKESYPLGMFLMIYAFIVACPRYFIEYYIGNFELGIFTAITYLTSSLILVANALADAALPRFGIYVKDRQSKKFLRLLLIFVVSTVIICTFGILLAIWQGEFILKHIYSATFTPYKQIFILSIGMMGLEVINKFMANCMTALRIINLQTVVFSWQLLCLIAGNYLFTKKYGIEGILIIQGFVNLVQVIFVATVINIKLKSLNYLPI